MFIYDLDEKICGLMIASLGMCKVMGPYIYVALLYLDWEYDFSLIRFYVK